jgi:hypothetical protein
MNGFSIHPHQPSVVADEGLATNAEIFLYPSHRLRHPGGNEDERNTITRESGDFRFKHSGRFALGVQEGSVDIGENNFKTVGVWHLADDF